MTHSPLVHVEVYQDGLTGLGKVPSRRTMKLCEVEAKNRGDIQFPSGINVIRIHEGNIFQIAGYNNRVGMFNYLVQPDGSLTK